MIKAPKPCLTSMCELQGFVSLFERIAIENSFYLLTNRTVLRKDFGNVMGAGDGPQLGVPIAHSILSDGTQRVRDIERRQRKNCHKLDISGNDALHPFGGASLLQHHGRKLGQALNGNAGGSACLLQQRNRSALLEFVTCIPRVYEDVRIHQHSHGYSPLSAFFEL